MAKRALENLQGAGIHHPVAAQGQPCKIPNTADSGYYSEEAVRELDSLPLDPYMATSRQRHYDNDSAQVACMTQATLSVKERMAQKLRSEAGRRSHATRKHEEQAQTWRKIAVVRSVSDLKTVTSHRLLDNLEYEPVAPDGELKHGTISEETYTRQLHTYGRMFALTWDKIIKDDLSVFDDIRTRLAAGAARKLNSVFWSTFLDNSSFFRTGTGNYIAGADTAVGDDGAGLQKAITAFRKLKSPDKKRIGGLPTILLVPPELQVVAQRLYQNTTIDPGGTTTGTANIHVGQFGPLTGDGGFSIRRSPTR